MNGMQRATVGAFLVGATLLFAIGLFFIGDRRLLFERQFELNTTLTRVTGLQVGSKVRVAGLDAGEVTALGLPTRPSEPFRVTMRLREDLRPIIRTDSICAVQTDGIVGSAFLQISPGTDEAPIVEPGGTIAGRDPIEFADLIEEGRETFRTVAAEMIDIGGSVRETISTLTETTQNANRIILSVGEDIQILTGTSIRVVEDAEQILEVGRGLVADVRAGKGTLGQLVTDDTQYRRWVGMTTEAEQVMANLRSMTDSTRGIVDSFTARDGAAQQIVQTLRDTLADTREVVSDLTEGTEALKRNFLFRGFFQDRGFFDLDTLSREAYMAGVLEGGDRTALRVWIEADMLFAPTRDGTEQLTPAGRRRIDSAMADLVRYPRDSPLVVEGFADGADGEVPYLLSLDRARIVRDYLVTRFGRRVTLTGVMALGDQAAGSPRGDGSWSGVALAMFVDKQALAAN
jgi:phospholipid/cholesterol/gamma-HCH transport system substrate-binding protein